VGTCTIEEDKNISNGKLEKILQIYGNTKPKMAKKGRDISGRFQMIKRFALEQNSTIDNEAYEELEGTESFYSGFLKKNQIIEGESVVFYPNHVLSTREDGTQKRIEGRYGSPLSAIEYFLENDIKKGDVYESKFILDGYPYIFRCEVIQLEILDRFGIPAYKIDVSTYDGLKKNKSGQPKIKKKKGISLWLCKHGKYKDRFLRVKIKYKWYLTLYLDMKKA
jgi:hypothetical protein